MALVYDEDYNKYTRVNSSELKNHIQDMNRNGYKLVSIIRCLSISTEFLCFWERM